MSVVGWIICTMHINNQGHSVFLKSRSIMHAYLYGYPYIRWDGKNQSGEPKGKRKNRKRLLLHSLLTQDLLDALAAEQEECVCLSICLSVFAFVVAVRERQVW